MNRKTLIFCLAGLAVLIALTVTGIFVLYRNSDTGKAPEKRTARAVSGDYRLLEAVPSDAVTVPDLKGLQPAQARAVMKNSGLYLQTKGSSWAYAVATDQEPAAGTKGPRGTTVTLELTDQTALD